MAKVFNSNNFKTEVLKSDKPALIDFFATWCGPCQMMIPIMNRLTETFSQKAIIGKVDVDESSDIAMDYGISGVPTIIIFKDGEVKEKFVGVRSFEVLKSALDKYI